MNKTPNEKTCKRYARLKHLYEPYDDLFCLKLLPYENFAYYKCTDNYKKKYNEYMRCLSKNTARTATDTTAPAANYIPAFISI